MKNPSTAIFLVDNNVSCCKATFEVGEGKREYFFKTLIEVKVDDYIVVPNDRANTHGLWICKVTDINVEFDIDTDIQLKWVVAVVPKGQYDEIIAKENQILKRIRDIEMKNKRAALQKEIFKDNEAAMASLAISNQEAKEEEGK